MHPYMTYKKYLFLYLTQSRYLQTQNVYTFIHINLSQSLCTLIYIFEKNVLTVIQFQETMSSFFLTTTTAMAQ